MSSSTSLLSLRDISHFYGERRVLHVPTLDISAGELLGLVGPSGAGKSTLLRLCNYLEAPSQGVVRYRDQSFLPQTIPLALRRRITTVFQQPHLLDASVQDNVGYGLWLRGRRDRQRRITAALQMVGLEHLGRAHARTLSSGEAQRVSLARALVLEPEILLLDEPTANLDPANVRIIEGIIERANSERGATIILVTHNVWQARRLARRVALIYEGEILEIASNPLFFTAPTHPQTAAFLSGEMVY